MTQKEMKAELDRLRAENESLRKQGVKKLSFKVSEKGGLSVYGLGRFPVTLYQTQWIRLLDVSEDIRGFITLNSDKLTTKDAPTPQAAKAAKEAKALREMDDEDALNDLTPAQYKALLRAAQAEGA